MRFENGSIVASDIAFDLPSLINQAPATVLCILVYLELRALRPIQQYHGRLLAALLERMRITPPGGIQIQQRAQTQNERNRRQ